MSDQPDWAEQARRLMVGLSGMFSGDAQMAAGPAAAPLAGDCRWCPLCQAAAVLRGERPEVTAAMADVLSTASAALRSFAAQGSPDAAAPGEPAGQAQPEPETAEPEPPGGTGPGVQRIEIA